MQRLIAMVEHPKYFLPEKKSEPLRVWAGEAEKTGKLHDEQLRIILEQRWFKMFVPVRFGGLGLSLPEILKIEEGLSWADGSSAWVVTLCAGAGWFIGFLDEKLASEIFDDVAMCLAGSGAITGEASRVNGGYEVTGTWRYASGAVHATAFTANCYIKENNQRLTNEDGSPVVRSFLFKREEVTIIPTWNSMGMVATASHSFTVQKQVVPEERCFIIDTQHAKLPDTIFQFPFLQLAETTLAINLSGMATRFADLFDAMVATQPDKSMVNEADSVALNVQLRLHAARDEFYHRVNTAWDLLVKNGSIPPNVLAAVSDVSQQLAAVSREVVSVLYPFGGLKAADKETEINRIWRNIHTAAQHTLFKKINHSKHL